MDVAWGFDFPVPHFTTVRCWLLRLGHYTCTGRKSTGTTVSGSSTTRTRSARRKYLLLALAACVSERTHEVVHKALRTSKTSPHGRMDQTKLGQILGSKHRLAYQTQRQQDHDKQLADRANTKVEGTPVSVLP